MSLGIFMYSTVLHFPAPDQTATIFTMYIFKIWIWKSAYRGILIHKCYVFQISPHDCSTHSGKADSMDRCPLSPERVISGMFLRREVYHFLTGQSEMGYQTSCLLPISTHLLPKFLIRQPKTRVSVQMPSQSTRTT